MYLCRELTDLSLPKIGAQFGNRDHTTVMDADRKINTLLAERRAVFNQVSELTNRVKMQARTRGRARGARPADRPDQPIVESTRRAHTRTVDKRGSVAGAARRTQRRVVGPRRP